MKYATCHPDIKHFAKGLCRACYYRLRDQEHNQNPAGRQRRAEAQRQRRERQAQGIPTPQHAARVPECHPERKHWARGLCRRCYDALKRSGGVQMAQCHPDRAHAARGLCRPCYVAYYFSEQLPEREGKRTVYTKRDRDRLRDDMLDAFGRRCACPRCPETNPAFLTLDHINGGGGQQRRAGISNTKVLRQLRAAGWPKDGYRLLCMNCNFLTRYGAVCPHMEPGASG